MSTIYIQTTQNVAVEYETAGVGDRIVARLLDWLVLLLYSIVVGFLIETGTHLGDDQQILMVLLIGIPVLLYNPLFEIFFNGQSLGKRARHLRVVRLDGTRPRVGDYLLRWLLGLIEIDICFGLIALITRLASSRGQRLGDLAAGTTVVNLRARADQDLLALADLDPNYQVVFPQAAQLTDHDAALVRRLLQQGLRRHNPQLLREVAAKVQALTGIQTDLADEVFLQTILRDHLQLVSGEMA
ncbi:RDD family protein [Hymenobacter sp. BT507]|uniref:RDD family protein n=1 Tax=Hymenobacter citatus TaxID=2763506 RepID=A0ABR7MI72_9BACT|nr:RDD family protein [Hymenobacter citatus]MBC6610787.1 RDD family protein [Hymenobacter citatus]